MTPDEFDMLILQLDKFKREFGELMQNRDTKVFEELLRNSQNSEFSIFIFNLYSALVSSNNLFNDLVKRDMFMDYFELRQEIISRRN